MEAKIIAEDDRGLGVRIIDNNSVEHTVAVGFDGEIQGHSQDGYSDKAVNRTEDENEHVNQARRFAKFYAYRERGYDTVEHTENPDYINAVRAAINELSDAEFEQYFGALYQQLESHNDPDVERLVDLPAGVRAEDAVVYEMDVALGLDLEDSTVSGTAEAIARARLLDFEDASSRPVTDASEADLETWEAVGEAVIERLQPEAVPLAIHSVSGIHVGFPNAAGEHEVQEAADPLERDADARIELMPVDPGTLEEFRTLLDHHLRSQVRDCIAGMGLFPPEPFQTVGFGKFIYARRYDHYDLYPKFHTGENSAENGLFG